MYTNETYQAVRRSSDRVTHACGHYHATIEQAEKCVSRPRNEVMRVSITYTRPYNKNEKGN